MLTRITTFMLDRLIDIFMFLTRLTFKDNKSLIRCPDCGNKPNYIMDESMDCPDELVFTWNIICNKCGKTLYYDEGRNRETAEKLWNDKQYEKKFVDCSI